MRLHGQYRLQARAICMEVGCWGVGTSDVRTNYRYTLYYVCNSYRGHNWETAAEADIV